MYDDEIWKWPNFRSSNVHALSEPGLKRPEPPDQRLPPLFLFWAGVGDKDGECWKEVAKKDQTSKN